VRNQPQLKETLTHTLQQAMLKFFRYKGYEEIKDTDYQFEKPMKDFHIYYVKYKEFIAKFRFDNDPAMFLIIPVEIRVLKQPGIKIERISSVLNKSGSYRKGSSGGSTKTSTKKTTGGNTTTTTDKKTQ